ncbi:MAG: dephospho-CoA kinase [Betaproteobacteria bacterium]|nr:dephospho-CoA kinase [Betaproteobacteria bacterium]
MTSPHIHRIGLTGGIGSGKSTLGQMMVARGIPLVDADAIAHQVTAPNGAGIETIRQQFGDAFINDKGALDRDRMRQHVFSNPQAKLALQDLLHPLIHQRMLEAIDEIANQGNSMVLIDIPLLVESAHWRQLLHKLIVVDCSEATQVRRVMARSQLAEADVRQIMANQANRSKRLAAADVVVFNDQDDLAHLQDQALQMALP